MSADDRERKALERLKRGDRSAIRVLYDLYAERLFRSVLMPLVRDRAAAEDALRDTFLSALERADDFGGDSALPWLATIARNKGLDLLRSRDARARLADRAAFESLPGPADPETIVAVLEEREQARARIEAILAEMNPRYARALRLRLVEERERADCAGRLGVSVGTFDVLLFRACKSFKSLYVQRYGEEP